MVKIGLVGAGFMGKMHSECYRLLPQAKVVAVCDLDREKASEIAKESEARVYTEITEMLEKEELDGVDICLPTYLHRENVIKAIRKGKNILCEKPIALTIKDAEEMIKEAERTKVKFMVAQVVRFWDEYRALKEIYEKKELGELISLNLLRLSPTPTWQWERWALNPKKAGGALLDLHIHDTDYAFFLLGKPKIIFSRGRKTKRGWDHVFTTFLYPEGKLVLMEGGWDMPENYPFTMVFRAQFEKGVVEYNSRWEKTLVIYREGEVEYPSLEKKGKEKELGGNIAELGGYFKEIEYFVKCLKEGKKPELSPASSARTSLELCLLELKSLEKGKPLKV